MKKIKIRIAGIGGQGIKFAGEILGEAATLNNYYATQRVSYTAAARGGPVHTDIIISDEPIHNPILETPDILCIMAQYALEFFKEEIKASIGCLLIVDDIKVRQIDLQDCLILRVDFSSVSKATNMVLIGFLAHLLSLEINSPSNDEIDPFYVQKLKYKHQYETFREILTLNPQEFENAINYRSPQGFKEINLKAFRRGYKLTGHR
ncbi:MAG: 2-oxoacid:acceptor oxidoreductase family protein [Promethearchaeota archaeon]